MVAHGYLVECSAMEAVYGECECMCNVARNPNTLSTAALLAGFLRLTWLEANSDCRSNVQIAVSDEHRRTSCVCFDYSPAGLERAGGKVLS